jgi:hypothetical protein
MHPKLSGSFVLNCNDFERKKIIARMDSFSARKESYK